MFNKFVSDEFATACARQTLSQPREGCDVWDHVATNGRRRSTWKIGHVDTTEMAKKVMKKLKEEVEKKGLHLSVKENGKEGKSKIIASCGFLENEWRQLSREEGVALADSVETLGVDLRTRVKKAVSKRKSKEEEVQGEVLTLKEE